MRSRSRIITNSVKAAAVYNYPQLLCYNASTSWTHSTGVANSAQPEVRLDEEYSSIQDQVGGGKRPKDVRHLKYRKTLGNSGPLYRSGTFGSPGGPGYNVGSSGNYTHLNYVYMDNGVKQLLVNPVTGIIPGVTVSWPVVDDRKAVQSLFDKARKPVVDGLLNLVESPEIPSAITSLSSYGAEKQRNWSKIVASIKASKLSRNLKNLSKDAANKYLAYSFGVAPLISDSRKVISYMEKIKQDYEKFRDRKIRRISVVYRGDLTFSLPNSGEYSFQGYATSIPEVRYVLTYREKNPYSSQFMAKLDFLLRRFGSAGPASFAWERIPFSFVVDWFVDTSSILDYLDSKLQSERIEVVSLTRSKRFVVLADCFRTVRRSDSNAVVYDQRQGNVMHSYYERSVIGKSTYVDLAVRFGKRQASLAVALLRQKLNKL